jgi:transposase
MRGKRYPEEFKIEAVKQVTEHGYSVASVADRLGVSSKTLYVWLRRYGNNSEQFQAESTQQEELRRLKAELQRVTQERDILKEAAVYFASESKKSTRS